MIGHDSVQYSRVVMDIRDGAAQDETVSKEFFVNCVGLEHLISRNVPKRYKTVKKARRDHSRLVLGEQKRQKDTCNVSSTKLAYASKRSSESSHKKAHTIAMMRESIVV